MTHKQSQEGITASGVPTHVYEIIRDLKQAGFEAYIVGGWVRDCLIGLQPKDFDIATDAHPEQVKAIFSNCRLIGRRFRLAHIYYRRHIVEVATFRASHEQAACESQADTQDGMIIRDNVYGTLEEDAVRRDFTANALYYDPVDEQYVDFVGARHDIDKKVLRIIGEPTLRFQEDPVRVLRAIRIANKTKFSIEPRTSMAMEKAAGLLSHIPPGRLYDEYSKLFLSGCSWQNFASMRQFGVFKTLFPSTALCLHESPQFSLMIERSLQNTDERILENKGINPAFLLAVFLWQPLQNHLTLLSAQSPDLHSFVLFNQAVSGVLADQVKYTAIPRRFAQVIRQIWSMQHGLELRRPRQILRILGHMRFRAAYDFLLLRQEAGEIEEALVEWWTQIQYADDVLKEEMINDLKLAKP